MAIDGQLILAKLVGRQEKYVIVSGGSVTPFFEAEGCAPCVWSSASGDQVVHPFVAPGDRFAAAVYDVRAGTTTELPPPPGFSALGPGPFSPDGARFARHGWSDTDPRVNGVYSSNVAGEDVVLVDPVRDSRGRDPMDWSPDGSRLLVWSEFADSGGVHRGDLSLVAVRTGQRRRINPDGTFVAAIILYGTAMSFSPDGKQVAFAASKTSQPADAAVFVADVSGGAARQITSWATGTTTALWSPDGQSILYDRRETSGDVISLVRPDGSSAHDIAVSTGAAPVCCATWSPDAEQLLFQRIVGKERQLWVMSTTGDSIGRVDVEAANWIWFRWTPQP